MGVERHPGGSPVKRSTLILAPVMITVESCSNSRGDNIDSPPDWHVARRTRRVEDHTAAILENGATPGW